MMNTSIRQGKWSEFQGRAKETFGTLTDDDLLYLEGSTERMVGMTDTN